MAAVKMYFLKSFLDESGKKIMGAKILLECSQ